jgi:general stress protein 26
MGDTKSLMNWKAIEKIQELAKDQVCLFCTHENGEIVSRPMSTQQIEDDGTMWFMSRNDSEKNRQVREDEHIYLMYMDTGKQHYMTLSGQARIVDDRQKIEELWSPIAKAWFDKGKDDPAISLLKFTPSDGHYWDTKNGKLISFIKIAASALTGAKDDGGIEGDIKL